MKKVLALLKEVNSAVVETTDGAAIDLKEATNIKFVYDHWSLGATLRFTISEKEMTANIDSLHSFLAILLKQTSQHRNAFIAKLEVAFEKEEE